MPSFDVLLGFVGGFFALFLGGEIVVFYTITLARRVKISAFFISMVLIGFSTSLPELFTCINAVLYNAPNLALGNIIGSNISNVWFILGLAALIWPLSFVRQDFIQRDSVALTLSVVVTWGIFLLGTIDYVGGLFLVLFLILYTGYSIVIERRLHHQEDYEQDLRQYSALNVWLQLGLLGFGIILLLVGADFLVGSTIALARWLQISETVIGLTVVAVGTSLPELAAALVAARKRLGDVALGNVIGSNLYNIFGVLGITSLVSRLEFSRDLVLSIVTMGVAIFLLVWVCIRKRVSRRVGMIFLVSYGTYLWYLF